MRAKGNAATKATGREAAANPLVDSKGIGREAGNGEPKETEPGVDAIQDSIGAETTGDPNSYGFEPDIACSGKVLCSAVRKPIPRDGYWRGISKAASTTSATYGSWSIFLFN